MKSEVSGLKQKKHEGRAEFEKCENLQRAFLNIAKKDYSKAVIADQLAGVKSFRNIITGIYALKNQFCLNEEKYIGIMLPASVTATVMYFTTLFSGKVPVMINWTVGERNIRHSIELLGVKKIYTSKTLIDKLKNQGTEFSEIYSYFEFLENTAKKVNAATKIFALIKSYIYPTGIYKGNYPDEAVVLFTSGSESFPKAVPLTHKNIMTNIDDVLKHIFVLKSDAMIGFLPPFHSFGLTVTMLVPVLSGIRVVYHSNPTEGGTLANLIKHYRATVLIGTPTFLSGILRSTDGEELKTLRFAVTGAEKCPESVYDAIEKLCDGVIVVEGYGITECSPIVSANTLENPVRQAIGKIMPSLEYRILDVDTDKPVDYGQKGMLFVRGDSVFEGYINFNGESPFVDIDGKMFYKTGDLVIEDENGTLFFAGRLKRFIKLGGEMISMPAIEEVIKSGILF